MYQKFGIRRFRAAADGSSLFNFARAWASVTKQVNLLDTKLTINDLVKSEGSRSLVMIGAQ